MRILQVDEKVEHYVQSDRGVLRRKSKDIWQCEKTTLDLNCISGWYTLNPDWAAKVEKAFQEFMQESQKEPETMLYDWDDKEIPEWVEWIAADGDREVYGFSHKPDFDVEY